MIDSSPKFLIDFIHYKFSVWWCDVYGVVKWLIMNNKVNSERGFI